MRLTNPNALPLLVVIEGQSNALANNNSPAIGAGWTTSHPGKMWWKPGSEAGGSAAWVTTGTFTHASVVRANMAIALQRRLIEEMGRTVAVVICAEGSTDLFSSWAAPPNNGAKDLLAVMSAEVTAALADPECPINPALPYRTVIIRRQGEADAAVEAYAAAYESRLTAHYDWAETQPWCVRPHWLEYQLNVGCTGDFVVEVRAAQAAAVAARSNATLVNHDELPLTDGLHYAQTSNTRMGVSLASQIMSLGL